MKKAERWQHLEKLENDANVLAAPGGQLILAHFMDVTASDDYLSIAGSVDACNHVEQRRFTVPRRPNNGHEFSLVDVKRQSF